VLFEGSTRIDAEKHIADVRVKRVNLFLKSCARRERCCVQKPDNRLDRPRVPHRHPVQDLTVEASLPTLRVALRHGRDNATQRARTAQKGERNVPTIMWVAAK
jgi:hypothetical protein